MTSGWVEMRGERSLICGSSRLRNGSWQGLPVFGGEEQAVHGSSAVLYHPGQPARSVRPSQSAQQAQLCCRQQRLRMGESKYPDCMDIAWKHSTISVWLPLRDVHAHQKINYCIQQALWAGRITSQYLEFLLGVGEGCEWERGLVCLCACVSTGYVVDTNVYRQQEVVPDCRYRAGIAQIMQK